MTFLFHDKSRKKASLRIGSKIFSVKPLGQRKKISPIHENGSSFWLFQEFYFSCLFFLFFFFYFSLQISWYVFILFTIFNLYTIDKKCIFFVHIYLDFIVSFSNKYVFQYFFCICFYISAWKSGWIETHDTAWWRQNWIWGYNAISAIMTLMHITYVP